MNGWQIVAPLAPYRPSAHQRHQPAQPQAHINTRADTTGTACPDCGSGLWDNEVGYCPGCGHERTTRNNGQLEQRSDASFPPRLDG
jgi:hypothetical protein